MTKKAIIVGASGLIGSNLLNILVNSGMYSEVLSISRKKNKMHNDKLKQLVIDLDRLEDHAAEITGDVVFCCLGTTKKQTPDEAEYRKIDHDYAVNLTTIAFKNGAEQCHLVSSVGADVKSSAFYLRTKGETEEDIKKIGVRSVFIYRPSMLLGRRHHTRLAERMLGGLMSLIGPLLIGGLKKYHSIKASAVAMAMYNRSVKTKPGVFTYTYNKIQQLA
ncbi:MAG TPA: NAD(P)H-binding protein [Mucilaginibacter sp.]|nr:NAD(P)H-binding protein [Mucilaginibacter sp.]